MKEKKRGIGEEMLAVTNSPEDNLTIFKKSMKRPIVRLKESTDDWYKDRKKELTRAKRHLDLNSICSDSFRTREKAAEQLYQIGIVQKIYTREERRAVKRYVTVWEDFEDFFDRVERQISKENWKKVKDIATHVTWQPGVLDAVDRLMPPAHERIRRLTNTIRSTNMQLGKLRKRGEIEKIDELEYELEIMERNKAALVESQKKKVLAR